MRHVLLLILCLAIQGQGQDDLSSPILRLVEAHGGLVTAKGKSEQKTRANILGASCAATKWTDVYLEPYGNHKFMLSYHIAIDIEDDKNPCQEGDVPETDTRFDLSFTDSLDSKSVEFRGEPPSECKKCKRARAISGTLTQLSDRVYKISFSGDLSDSVELEPLSNK
jgi:hypothetical protein